MTAMTEAEARGKWCPFARVLVTTIVKNPLGHVTGASGASANRGESVDGAPIDRANCIASGCVAWRWAGWVNLLRDGSLEQSQTKPGPQVMTHGPTQNPHGCVKVGYCGLAGSAAP